MSEPTMDPATDNSSAPQPELARMLQSARLAAVQDDLSHSSVDPLPMVALDAPIESTFEDSDEQQLPAQIAGFTVLEEISSGGQGTVFKAVQKSTGQAVAIKVLPGGRLVGARRKERFDREANVLASLTHPNIVRIIDRGAAADGSLYLVMHYIDGFPLDVYAQMHANSGVEGLLQLFVKICRAVQDAHEHGVIHRDLKPGNIRVDLGGQPHVLDFGLARVLDGEQGSFVTATVQVLGSLAWASPEQASGHSSALDACSDVYSLGVILYHVLTAHFPYAVDVPIPQLISNIVSISPKAPSRLMNALPANAALLDTIVLKALAKSAADRYASAGALADDLEQYLADQGGTTRRIAVPRPRKRAGVALVGAVAFLLIGAGGWRSWHRPQRSEAAGNSLRSASLGVQPGGTPPDTRRFSQVQRGADLAGKTTFINSVGMTMAFIPAGQYMMGSPENELGHKESQETLHQVTISRPFYMGAMLVTRDQYRLLIKELQGPKTLPGNLPVNFVDWSDATRYCQLLSEREHRVYHLPTEAQWEYACRAGTTGMFGGTGRLDEMGWYDQQDGEGPHVGGLKLPNAWGLYDMHGNLQEWCSDYRRNYPATPETDPTGDGGNMRLFVIKRGGNYQLPLTECRSAARAWDRPVTRSKWIGFRVVMDMPQNVPPMKRP